MNSTQANLTYKGSGVDYDSMDPFKRDAQMAAQETAINMHRHGFNEIGTSRGESVYLFIGPGGIFGHVEEGLGTKNLVADAMYTLTAKSYYDNIAQCTVAMIVNDMVTLGIMPISVAMHLAVGDSAWFNDQERTSDLITGWKNACDLARCTWGGGETPTLKGIIVPDTALLSGSGIGFTTKIIETRVKGGDAIILLESSGIHANGLTLARKIADGLDMGYMTKLSDGRSYGDTLLDPTHIYVGVVEDLMNEGIAIKYATNITGHGWRKLMRLDRNFTYRIKQLPTQLPVFDFIQKHGNITDEEMYGNFNMGAGFALFIPDEQATQTVAKINTGNYGFRALHAGTVEYGEKQVIIEPKNLVFKSDTLAVR